MSKRFLILQDGTVFSGEAFGAPATTFGEIVFYTGMTGYQEVITNPIYHNQFITFTTPTIGAAGINHRADESITPVVKGVIAREIAEVSTNRLQQMTLDAYLKRHNIPGVSKIDTRALARHLRKTGTQKASIVDEPDQHAFDQLSAMVLTTKQVQQVATPKAYANPGRGANVVVIDFGLKSGLLRVLSDFDANVTVLPATATIDEVANLDPDGLVLSSGPGAPQNVPDGILTLIRYYQERVPLFGVGLGHELFALANGAKLNKIPVERHGMNHPIREQITNRVIFATQGQGFGVDIASLAELPLLITHIDLTDNSVQGLRHRDFPAFSVQFFPDAAPGPLEATQVFAEFMEVVTMRKEGAV
ncbi:carbamoyl phosphate synthase small subunit [Weissella muntiaci]|uniref:Carbamoyl phosphate synthase small chain n=1 Tax=Weissella muntiaci TaxID=2508881 RepID=A0A6C2C877_9LACO|nr:carbamoyl phosphate synthase small subunit [Weissella muntiaci]TYC50218.1 carbamoyl phosphate synthase small subunit [Weissella muntiaci]